VTPLVPALRGLVGSIVLLRFIVKVMNYPILFKVSHYWAGSSEPPSIYFILSMTGDQPTRQEMVDVVTDYEKGERITCQKVEINYYKK